IWHSKKKKIDGSRKLEQDILGKTGAYRDRDSLALYASEDDQGNLLSLLLAVKMKKEQPYYYVPIIESDRELSKLAQTGKQGQKALSAFVEDFGFEYAIGANALVESAENISSEEKFKKQQEWENVFTENQFKLRESDTRFYLRPAAQKPSSSPMLARDKGMDTMFLRQSSLNRTNQILPVLDQLTQQLNQWKTELTRPETAETKDQLKAAIKNYPDKVMQQLSKLGLKADLEQENPEYHVHRNIRHFVNNGLMSLNVALYQIGQGEKSEDSFNLALKAVNTTKELLIKLADQKSDWPLDDDNMRADLLKITRGKAGSPMTTKITSNSIVSSIKDQYQRSSKILEPELINTVYNLAAAAENVLVNSTEHDRLEQRLPWISNMHAEAKRKYPKIGEVFRDPDELSVLVEIPSYEIEHGGVEELYKRAQRLTPKEAKKFLPLVGLHLREYRDPEDTELLRILVPKTVQEVLDVTQSEEARRKSARSLISGLLSGTSPEAFNILLKDLSQQSGADLQRALQFAFERPDEFERDGEFLPYLQIVNSGVVL
ncbi:MAG: hypothetical protein KC733_05675, partial [Candidatus Omnitrophica bacterium]|nr:hypothetical protein [Candidatus Omnitrophota bacterium]